MWSRVTHADGPAVRDIGPQRDLDPRSLVPAPGELTAESQDERQGDRRYHDVSARELPCHSGYPYHEDYRRHRPHEPPLVAAAGIVIVRHRHTIGLPVTALCGTQPPAQHVLICRDPSGRADGSVGMRRFVEDARRMSNLKGGVR
jgi:hypothetical protein